LIPGGALFNSISSGRVSVVTDEIDRFTETGLLLKTGDQIAADVIVTATGFNLSVLGDIDFVIDGAKLNFADTVTYRGVMFTGVPNTAWVFGYLRESWTMRSDLVSDFVCRLLNHMKDKRRLAGDSRSS
jgi:cation diffusion facilitator CzcD-associated flavoprotein CzcO